MHTLSEVSCKSKSVPYVSDIGAYRLLCAIGAYAQSDGVGGFFIRNPEGNAVAAFGREVFDELLSRRTITWEINRPYGEPDFAVWVLSRTGGGA